MIKNQPEKSSENRWNRRILQITSTLPTNFKIRKAAKIMRKELLKEG